VRGVPEGRCLALALLLFACDSEPQRARATPFSGEQLDRIEAAFRSRAPEADADLPLGAPPLWVANELLDDRTRLVVHVRLGASGDLADIERHEVNCARVRALIQEQLLPGQEVEMYLVFDTTVLACPKPGLNAH
jgi:hypothetical protein